jgi:preprotein translocase subunit SecD
MLNTSNSSNAIGLPPGLSLAWSSNIEEVDGDPHRYLYVLESEPIIENRHLSDASVDMNDFGRWVISFELTEEGGRRMGEVSEQHVDEAMAILFDGGVQSAPVIRARIGRRGQIEMGNSLVDAHRLVGMLVAGSLPAPVRVIEGPTAN